MPDDLVALILAQQQQIAELASAMQRQSAAISALAPQPDAGFALTVDALRTDYDVVVKSRASSESVRIHLAPWVAHFGPRLVLSLRASDVIAFRDGQRLTVTKRKAPRAPGTRNAEVYAFMAMINWAVREGRLARNPIGRVKALPVTPLETTIANDDEPAIMRAASPVMRAIFVLGVDVGMRLNEIRLLEWSWVDLAGKTISLPDWVTKTRKARKPRITSRAVDVLRELPRFLRSPHVFPNPRTGKPYTRHGIERWWRTLRAEVGLQPAPGEKAVRFHSTRHTAATRINKVAGFRTAMKQLGQTSPGVALRYVHSTETDLDEMRDKLDEIAKQSRRPPHRVESRTQEKQEAVE